MPDKNRTECDCDCHRTGAPALVCSACAPQHGPRVVEDLRVILSEFARELDDEDAEN